MLRTARRHLRSSPPLNFMRGHRAAGVFRPLQLPDRRCTAFRLLDHRCGVDEARVILGWAPGGDAPFLIEAWTSHGGVNLQVPRDELPAEEWLTIQTIVRDLELAERDWAADLLAGYFCQCKAPWER